MFQIILKRRYLLEHINEVETIILDQPGAKVEAGSIGKVDQGLRHRECEATNMGFLQCWPGIGNVIYL